MNNRNLKLSNLPILFITIIIFIAIIYNILFTILASDVSKVTDKYGYTYYADRQGNKIVDKTVRYKGEYLLLDQYGYPVREAFVDGYYYDKYGVRVVDRLVNIAGTKAYFDHDGTIIKNKWIHADNYDYYAGEDGFFVKDTWVDDTYYLDKDGHLLKDTITPDGCMVDKDGKFVFVNDYNINIKEINNGDVIKFGKYNKKDIEWIVLDKYAGRLLLISKYIFDGSTYNNTLEPTSWHESSLRKYLNEDFYYERFSRKDRDCIVPYLSDDFGNDIYNQIIDDNEVDLVSIPSKEEIRKYFGIGAVSSGVNEKIITPIYPNVNFDKIYIDDGNASYWLRNNGINLNYAMYIKYNGVIESQGAEVTNESIGIRPCIWVNFER